MSSPRSTAASLRHEPVAGHAPAPVRLASSGATATAPHLVAVPSPPRRACATCRAIGPLAASRCGHYPAT